jgi:hypothetical protein
VNLPDNYQQSGLKSRLVMILPNNFSIFGNREVYSRPEGAMEGLMQHSVAGC